nr:PQQ-binding-like beta-propeller repeat protein [Deltaproteobacteria bacterium]
GTLPAVELIDIDAGRVVWRDPTACNGPVVGVTEDAIVCTDGVGTRGVKLDGKGAWRNPLPFIAMTEDRVVIADAGVSVVLDAATGDEIARIKLPAGVAAESIIASCGDAGRELFSIGQDGRLLHVMEAAGGPKIMWSTPIGAVAKIEACDGEAVLVSSETSLIALARATGKVTGRIDDVRGSWPARGAADRIEISTSVGVASYARDLVGDPLPTSLPVLGELLATRGDQRFVRATALTAVLIDRAGVRAYVPFASLGAVLGDRAIIASSWTGSQAETVRRIGLPQRYTKSLRIPGRVRGVAVTAELRDLPAPKPIDLATAIEKPDTGKHAIGAVAVDPAQSGVLYTVPIEKEPDDTSGAGLAAIDLATRAWKWQRTDGCGAGAPIAIAVAREIVVCGARGTRPGTATVRATSRDGAARWDWEGDSLDAVQAAGDYVLVHAANHVYVLDARTGRVRARLAGDDGAAMRATVVAVGDRTVIVTFERGRLIARVPDLGMLPVWSLHVHGVVSAISPSHDGVLVELEDGDAVRIAALTGEAIAMPGLGLTWRATGELVTGAAVGGPLPGPMPLAVQTPPLRVLAPVYGRPSPPREPGSPPMSVPIRPPPPLGDSWQYTLYELGGGLRARNDYAISSPAIPALARGPAGSPLVIAHGSGQREILVLDPRTGDPLRQVTLPEDAPAGVVFATIVDGTPVAGTVLASPLRIVLF